MIQTNSSLESGKDWKLFPSNLYNLLFLYWQRHDMLAVIPVEINKSLHVHSA